MKDYAKAENMGRWLRHPAMGDPSFDSFVKVGETVHVSKPPYEWAVNGSLYEDKDGIWYLYPGLYGKGYTLSDPKLRSHFVIYRSRDRGAHWECLGPGLAPGYLFGGQTVPSSSCPDVTVFWDERRGKYLLSYDWSTDNMTWEIAHDTHGTTADSGAAVAWGDTPAGPFTRIPQTVTRNTRLRGRYGRYDRFYAATVIPRKNDYLALSLIDSGPNFAWAYAACTAKTPEDGFTDPVIVLSPDRADYYPTPMEYHPAFTVDDTVYAPATSVARNRNYQFLFSAPLEEAHKPEAWSMVCDGSLWHARPLVDEAYGLWGQTINGFVGRDRQFNVMFCSRNREGMGTVSVASRPWDTPNTDGFTLSGHDGPSVTLLRDAYLDFTLDAEFSLCGTADFLFDFHGKVGPDCVSSDCCPCPEAQSAYTALRLCGSTWQLVRDGAVLVSGRAAGIIDRLTLKREKGILTAFCGPERLLCLPSDSREYRPLGLAAGRFSVLTCTKFQISGDCRPANFLHNREDAILGAGIAMDNFRREDETLWGASRIKWNVRCASFTLRGKRRPGSGSAEVRADGQSLGTVSFDGPIGDADLFTARLPYGPHGIELIPRTGEWPLPELLTRED